MKAPSDHPNEPGRWTLLDYSGARRLWRRERSDPVPLTVFYLINPPGQGEILYDEAKARSRFAQFVAAQPVD